MSATLVTSVTVRVPNSVWHRNDVPVHIDAGSDASTVTGPVRSALGAPRRVLPIFRMKFSSSRSENGSLNRPSASPAGPVATIRYDP